MYQSMLHDTQCENEMPSLEHLGRWAGEIFLKISYIQISPKKVRHVNPFLKICFHRREKHINIRIDAHNTQYQGFKLQFGKLSANYFEFQKFY